MEIFNTMRNAAVEVADQPALIDGEKVIDWYALPELVDRICLGLVHHGMRRCKGVAILCERSRHLPLSLLAIMRGGAVAVPLAAHADAQDVFRIIDASMPTVLIYDEAHADLASEIRERLEFRAVVRIGGVPVKGEIAWNALEKTNIEGSRFPVLDGDQVVLHNYGLDAEGMLYAGIGRLDHLWSLAGIVNRAMKIHIGDRQLDLFPAGINAHESVIRVLQNTGTLVCCRSNEPRDIFAVIRQHGVNVLVAPACLYHTLCDHAAVTAETLPDMRIVEARGHVTRPLARRVKHTLGQELLPTWSAAATLVPVMGAIPSGFGAPASPLQTLPGFRERIVDSTGKVIMGDGVGELCFSSEFIPQKLIAADGRHQLALDGDGWLHTGMLARRRDSGEIVILGSRFDVVLRNRERVYIHKIADSLEHLESLRAVEMVVLEHGGGEFSLVAAIELEPGSDHAPQASHCMEFLWEHLQTHEMPDDVVVIDEMPRLPNLDVDLHALKQLVRQRVEG